MKNFLENIYGILFAPKTTIEKIIETKPMWQAFTIITVLSLTSAVLNNFNGFTSFYDFLFFVGNLLVILILSFIIWFTLTGFFEATARVFTEENRFRPLLCLVSFSLIPWIFTAPLVLLKINIPLIITSTILELIIWIWSIVLLFLSVKQLYNLSTGKTWLFFAIPVIGSIVAANWVSQFFAILTGMV